MIRRGCRPRTPALSFLAIPEGQSCSGCGYTQRPIEVVQLSPDVMLRDEREEDAWRQHVKHATAEYLSTESVSVLRDDFDVAPIRKQHGSWAVTTYGVECLVTQYAIHKSRLFEQRWHAHMAEKVWVALDDFTAALRSGRAVYRVGISPRLRFTILERDRFRCRLCGLTANDGTTLEVDHKVPVVEGGKSVPDNLWTLCWDCNRGKGARTVKREAFPYA